MHDMFGLLCAKNKQMKNGGKRNVLYRCILGKRKHTHTHTQTLTSFRQTMLRTFLFLCCLSAGAHARMSWPETKYSYVDPVFTAYNPSDYSIDTKAIGAYAKQSVDSGVNVILLGGSTAEWPSLTQQERLELLKAWRTAVDSLSYSEGSEKPQILFHAGDISIAAAQTLASKSKEYGADAILIVSPCIMKPPTVQDLVSTIKSIAGMAPSLPSVYYHYPALYTVDFKMDEFLDLSSDPVHGIPTLAGVKYIDGDMNTFTNATGVENSSYTLFNNDPLLAGMAAGSKGAISYTTIFPMVQKMRAAYESGDMDAARKIERDIIEYGALINTYGAKSAARNLPKLFGGPDLGPPRPPLVPQTPEQFNSFKAALEAAGFLQGGDKYYL